MARKDGEKEKKKQKRKRKGKCRWRKALLRIEKLRDNGSRYPNMAWGEHC